MMDKVRGLYYNFVIDEQMGAGFCFINKTKSLPLLIFLYPYAYYNIHSIVCLV